MSWGGRIPDDRTLNQALSSCVHCGAQYNTSPEATACEQRHENR